MNTTQKAPVLDQDGVQLTVGTSSVVSSDPGVARVDWEAGPITISGISAGTATITATRALDSATAELEVEVTDAPFAISLGNPVPR
jgi:uncharacterized protein YjdB